MTESHHPTRRVFLGRAAGAAGAVTGGALLTGAAGCSVDASRAAGDQGKTAPRRIVTAENSLPGDRHWAIKNLGAPDAIMGFAGQAGVLPGEPIQLYVSTTAREFVVRAFRIGWYNGDTARKVYETGAVRGHRQRPSTRTPVTNTVQCDWGLSVTIPTDGWPPGSYLLRLDAQTGAQRYVPVTVRSPSTAGKVVIKNGVATWQAYNTWGDYDLYLGPAGYADRALVVSLDRPYDKSGAYLFEVYERKLITLAERMGLPLAYLTSTDIATDPHVLDGASALISPGHDEYWTPPERAHVTAARDAGVNLMFTGANACFRRIRLEPTKLGPYRLVVCYKTSYLQDPMYGKDNWLVTNDFPAPPDPDPEQSMIGIQYTGYPVVGDYVVTVPDSWVYKGTGARDGTRYRALVGIEFDSLDPAYPMVRPIELLSHSPVLLNGVSMFSNSSYYTHPGGAGVFAVGTMRWVESFGPPLYHWGITPACGAFTRKVTENVLLAFADGPAAAKHPARDNLAALHV